MVFCPKRPVLNKGIHKLLKNRHSTFGKIIFKIGTCVGEGLLKGNVLFEKIQQLQVNCPVR